MPTVVNNTQVVFRCCCCCFGRRGTFRLIFVYTQKLKCTWHTAKLAIPVRNRRSVYIESSVVTHMPMVRVGHTSSRAYSSQFFSIYSFGFLWIEINKKKNIRKYAYMDGMAWHGSICKEKNMWFIVFMRIVLCCKKIYHKIYCVIPYWELKPLDCTRTNVII